jgi:hypothetical protein
MIVKSFTKYLDYDTYFCIYSYMYIPTPRKGRQKVPLILDLSMFLREGRGKEKPSPVVYDSYVFFEYWYWDWKTRDFFFVSP